MSKHNRTITEARRFIADIVTYSYLEGVEEAAGDPGGAEYARLVEKGQEARQKLNALLAEVFA